MHNPYIILWLILILPISFLSAQDSQIQDEKFAQLFEIASTCLDSSDGDCTQEFKKCAAYVNTLTIDTIAGSYYLMLGTIRMKKGRWDDISLELFKAADRRNRKSGDACAIVKSQFALTRFARFRGSTDSSLVLANRALEAALACGDQSKVARAENFLGSAYVENGSFNDGLNHFQQADRIYSSIGDSLGLASLMLDMSAMYSQMHEKEKARSYTYKAATLFKIAGEDIRYAISLIDFSADLTEVNMADSALKLLPIAEKIIQGKHPRAEAYMQQNYGGAYYIKQEYSKAITHYKKGLVLNEKVGDPGLEILLNIFISENYLKLNQPELAHHYALTGESLAQSIPRNFKRSQAYLALAESAYASKHFDLSYQSFKQFIVLRDSLLGAEKRRIVTEMENSYEAEKKQKQIELAQKENDLLEAKNAVATNRNLALAICLILLVVITVGIISRKNGKLKIQNARIKVEELENEKLHQELAYRKRELSSKALHLARNSEVLNDLKTELQSMSDADSGIVKSLTRKLKIREIQDRNWESFIHEFNELNPNFHKSLIENYGPLTTGEMRLAALIRMGIQTKEIASMLNISDQGVKKGRHRLRKKMKIESTESLESTILQI